MNAARDTAISERTNLNDYLAALEKLRTATTARVRHRNACLIDGPFAETKEQLGGF